MHKRQRGSHLYVGGHISWGIIVLRCQTLWHSYYSSSPGSSMFTALTRYIILTEQRCHRKRQFIRATSKSGRCFPPRTQKIYHFSLRDEGLTAPRMTGRDSWCPLLFFSLGEKNWRQEASDISYRVRDLWRSLYLCCLFYLEHYRQDVQ